MEHIIQRRVSILYLSLSVYNVKPVLNFQVMTTGVTTQTQIISFFQRVPSPSWKDWCLSYVPFQSERPPSMLSVCEPPSQRNNCSFAPNTLESARELSAFLGQYYSADPMLILPPRTILELFQQGHRFAILRKKGVLIACCGQHVSASHGLITWLCVHPQWRGKKLSHCLFWFLYSHGPSINWFRNDALLKSPLPPVWQESVLSRRPSHTQSHSVQLIQITPKLQIYLADIWKRQNPTGICLFSENPTVKCSRIQDRQTELYVLHQSTYERHESGLTRGEILSAISTGLSDSYTESQMCEQIVNTLSYDIVEAPSTMPHVEALWKKEGMRTWTVTGFHPGVPFRRPVLPFSA